MVVLRAKLENFHSVGANTVVSVVRPTTRWQRAGFAALNVWIVFHIFSMMITPATIGPTSQTSFAAWRVVSPYPQSLFLAHGFHYFAPEPGSSTLLSYEATQADGTIVRGTLPNRDIFPRLLYHRNFMVTEYLGGVEPDHRDLMVQTFANHIRDRHQAEEVSLVMVRHDLPTMSRVRVGGSAMEPDLYEEEFLGTFRWDAASSE